MALQDLNEKLYSRDAKLNRELQDTFDPETKVSENIAQNKFQEKELWQQPVRGMDPIEIVSDVTHRRKVRLTAFIASGFIVVALLIGGVLNIRSMLFDEASVLVLISGPKDVVSAEETTFTVSYANDNWGKLQNTELELTYPDTFHIIEDATLKVNGSGRATITLGEMPANTQKKFSFKGKFYGSKGDKVTLQATLKYAPKNLSSVLEKTSQMVVTLASSPLFLEVTAPLEIVTGQNIEYVVDYGNNSDKAFSNIRVKMDYPAGFQFVSAEPKPSEGDTVWYMGNVGTYEKGKITIRGIITGIQKGYKSVRGTIGFYRGDNTFAVYSENERQTRVVASPLSISQTVNGLAETTVGAGELLQYTIHYKNDGDIGLRDAIITAQLDPTFLNLSRLSSPKGSYDGVHHMLVWKASDVPALKKLEVGAEGSVSFTVPVMDTLKSDAGKNLVIQTTAKIDSLDIPTPLGSNKIIASNTLAVKLKSDVAIDAYTLYTDTVLPNSGPVPPKVGQETSYTIHLSVAHSLSDIKDAKMTILLPAGVQYKEKYSPLDASFVYNERSNEIIWNMGTISAEDRVKDITFQVSILPGIDRQGKGVVLVSAMNLTGKDVFTDQEINKAGPGSDNTLKRDTVYGQMLRIGDVQPAD